MRNASPTEPRGGGRGRGCGRGIGFGSGSKCDGGACAGGFGIYRRYRGGGGRSVGIGGGGGGGGCCCRRRAHIGSRKCDVGYGCDRCARGIIGRGGGGGGCSCCGSGTDGSCTGCGSGVISGSGLREMVGIGWTS